MSYRGTLKDEELIMRLSNSGGSIEVSTYIDMDELAIFLVNNKLDEYFIGRIHELKRGGNISPLIVDDLAELEFPANNEQRVALSNWYKTQWGLSTQVARALAWYNNLGPKRVIEMSVSDLDACTKISIRGANHIYRSAQVWKVVRKPVTPWSTIGDFMLNTAAKSPSKEELYKLYRNEIGITPLVAGIFAEKGLLPQQVVEMNFTDFENFRGFGRIKAHNAREKVRSWLTSTQS